MNIYKNANKIEEIADRIIEEKATPDDYLFLKSLIAILKKDDYLNHINFWARLEMFVGNVQVHDMMSEEEKGMIMRMSKERKPSK